MRSNPLQRDSSAAISVATSAPAARKVRRGRRNSTAVRCPDWSPRRRSADGEDAASEVAELAPGADGWSGSLLARISSSWAMSRATSTRAIEDLRPPRARSEDFQIVPAVSAYTQIRRIALSWAGSTMIELIEPDPEVPSVTRVAFASIRRRDCATPSGLSDGRLSAMLHRLASGISARADAHVLWRGA